MGWDQLLVAFVLPTLLGRLAAWPLWRRRQWIVGNAVGVGVLFTTVIFLIGSAYVEQQRANQDCVAGLIPCVSRVDAHMPFLTYALIAMIDACLLFWWALKAEERDAPQGWQRS